MLHLPIGTFSRTATEVLAVGQGIYSYSQSGGVLELEGGVPSTRDETLASSDGNYAVVSWSATTGSHNSEKECHPRICLVSQGNVNPQLRVQVSSQLV